MDQKHKRQKVFNDLVLTGVSLSALSRVLDVLKSTDLVNEEFKHIATARSTLSRAAASVVDEDGPYGQLVQTMQFTLDDDELYDWDLIFTFISQFGKHEQPC